jgi:hypothetical protein
VTVLTYDAGTQPSSCFSAARDEIANNAASTHPKIPASFRMHEFPFNSSRFANCLDFIPTPELNALLRCKKSFALTRICQRREFFLSAVVPRHRFPIEGLDAYGGGRRARR